MSLAEIVPSSISRSKLISFFQNAVPNRMTGTGRVLRVCTRVSTSNSSSRVPKPPGKATKALARIMKCILRSAK
ncbi:hypothetical protein D3C79_1010250 [compost metagenome]